MLPLKKLMARNDNAHAEIVLPLTFLSLFMGAIFTGVAVILAIQGGQEVALAIISVLAMLSWASLALLAHKYSRITM